MNQGTKIMRLMCSIQDNQKWTARPIVRQGWLVKNPQVKSVSPGKHQGLMYCILQSQENRQCDSTDFRVNQGDYHKIFLDKEGSTLDVKKGWEHKGIYKRNGRRQDTIYIMQSDSLPQPSLRLSSPQLFKSLCQPLEI